MPKSDSMYTGDWVLSSILEDRAERMGDKIALDALTGKLSYAELRNQVQRVAHGLTGLGIGPGDTVATMLDSNVDHVVSWFAVAWAGAVEVPINTDLRGILLQHILTESEASVLVVADRWVERLPGLQLPFLRHIVVVGDAEPAATTLTVHRLTELKTEAPLGRVARDENDLTYILYTSGTTGPSKGAMHSGRSALWTAQVWIDMMRLTGEDIGYSMLPLFHVTARTATTSANFMAGGSVAIRERFSASGFWDDIRATDATNFMYMGAIIHLLAARPPHPSDSDHRARMAGGAAAPPHLANQFRERFGVELVEVFGMTEVGTVTGHPYGTAKAGSMGKPFDHITIEIHDERDNVVSPGTAGEITVRPNVPGAISSGYWKNPGYTVDTWRNLWFHTGDRGRMTEDGELVYIDRIKDSLRRRGENISSFEVERGVQAHPDVLECAAYAVPSDLTEDEVMVAVVPQPGVEINERALFEFCIKTLPRFVVPRYIRVVDALPKTPTNRVQKYVLRSEGVVEGTADLGAFGLVVPKS